MKRKTNRGERRQYYTVGSHPAIISKEIFEAVQEEQKRRSNVDIIDGKKTRKYIFSCCACSSVGTFFFFTLFREVSYKESKKDNLAIAFYLEQNTLLPYRYVFIF